MMRPLAQSIAQGRLRRGPLTAFCFFAFAITLAYKVAQFIITNDVDFMIFWYVFLLLLPFTFQGLQAYQDYVLNAYGWIMVGILFRLPKLALSAQFAATAPAQQPQFAPQPALNPVARGIR